MPRSGGQATENTTMQQLYLGLFVAAMISLVVFWLYLYAQTEKPHQLCGQRRWTNITPAASLSKKKGAGIGWVAPHQSLKKLNRVCDH